MILYLDNNTEARAVSSSRNGRNGGCSSFFMTSPGASTDKAEVK